MIRTRLSRWVLWASLVASLQAFGCREQTPRINVERVVGPPAAEIVDLVARGESGEPLAIARSSDFLWARGSEWEATRPFEGGAWHRQAMAASDSMIWARGSWWWLDLGGDDPVLQRSKDGRVWEEFALPGTALSPGQIADRNAVPETHLSLETAQGSVYLVGPMRIWRLDQSGEPVWHRVDLDGVALDESGAFPAFIRNYLPRTSEREFELLTTFGRQLKVYRRVAADLPWMMVSSPGTIDRKVVGTNDGGSIFVVAPDGLRRSSDEGETWFRFWPDDAASLTTIAFVADNGGQLGYALLAGASDGTVFRSLDQGTTWSVAREGGPGRREISAFAVANDGITVRAATRGRGVLLSDDAGQTWERDNGPMRGARPEAIALRGDGTLLVANAAGVWEQTGGNGAGEWRELHARRSSALLAGEDGVIVTGTVDGSVLVQTTAQDVSEVNSLFRSEAGVAVEPRIESGLEGERAVVILRRRAGGKVLQAWSKGNGAAFSTDGGRGWQPLPLDRSLVDALAGSRVVDVSLDEESGIYLTVRHDDGAFVIWYSDDDGLTWQAIREVEGEHARLLVLGPSDGGALFLISELGVERSLDNGKSWRRMRGPWDGLDIIGASHRPGRLLMLVDSRPGFEAMFLDAPGSSSPTKRRYLLNWPENGPETAPRAVEMEGEQIVFMGERAVWQADLPGAQSPVPVAVTFIAMVLTILAVSAIVFFTLRRFA